MSPSMNNNNNNNNTEILSAEPMLKHYISNYAVVRSSITSQDTLSPNGQTVIHKLSTGLMSDEFDDGFYLLDRDRNKSINTASMNMNMNMDNIDNSLLLTIKQ